MEILRDKLNIDFLGKRNLAIALSAILLIICIGSLIFRSLNFGIDFTGGTLVEVAFSQAPDIQKVRDGLKDSGFEAQVQTFGKVTDLLVRLAPRPELKDDVLRDSVNKVLREAGGGSTEIRRMEFVGPKVGDELKEDGGIAMILALGAILIYVWLRFERRFALGAIFALIHDVLIVFGVFSLTHMEFDLTVLAAILAVIGYSLNDTIVVFDRIRENFRTMRKGSPAEIINRSLNQTLSRTLVTSLTTLLVLFALASLGGEIIFGFAFALIVGIFVGTYSSIYVASTTALMLGVNKMDLMPVEKEGDNLDHTP